MRFLMRHRFPTTVASYWDTVFFDAEFNRQLYKEALQFPGYEVLAITGEPGGARTRKIRTTPKAEIPTALKGLLGGGLVYEEDGAFDPKTGHYKLRIVPNVVPDKVSIEGDFWLEARGEKEVERFCQIDLQVKVFGIGGIAEGFIERTVRESYEKAAAFTVTYLQRRAATPTS